MWLIMVVHVFNTGRGVQIPCGPVCPCIRHYIAKDNLKLFILLLGLQVCAPPRHLFVGLNLGHWVQSTKHYLLSYISSPGA